MLVKMNSEKTSLDKGKNKFKEKTRTKNRYKNYTINKSFNIRISKVRNEFILKKKYSFSNNYAYNNIIYKQLLGIIYYLIIFLHPIISSSKKISSELRTLNSYEEIIIKVHEGEQMFVNHEKFKYFPDQIILNGVDITQSYKDNGNIANAQGTENVVNLRWNNKLLNCSCMFETLDKIISIDFSDFDFSLVESTSFMFFECKTLIFINFGKSGTSSLKEMNFMFTSCFSLVILDLHKFNTKKVTNMGAAFKDATSLTSINISSFDTSNVKDLSYMFCGCFSLKYLDVHNFNTTSATNMFFMFYKCTSLKSLDLSSFYTKNIPNMASMFENCYSLTSLNLANFNTNGVSDMSRMFYNCTSLLSLDLSSFDISSVSKIENMFDKCISLKFLNLKSFQEASSFTSSPFTIISNDLVVCIDEKKSPYISSALKAKGLTNNCSDICFLDANKIDVDERNCIFYCENSEICKYENKDICCDKCPEGTKPKNNICVNEETVKITDLTTEKTETNNCTSEMFFKKICGTNSSLDQNNIINNIKTDIRTHKIDLSNLTNSTGKNNDIIIKERGTVYQITSSNNQNNENYEDLSTIKLGECEDKLKEKYHIDKNLSLIIFKIEHNVPGILIPIISYEIYDPTYKNKLELDECKDIFIDLNIPINISNDDIIKYDPESEYYNDECYPYTTENGTDILINDRIDEYNNNNMSLCEKNCEFNGYEENTKKAQCKCKTKSTVDNISEIDQSNDLLQETNFEKKNSTLNILTMTCTYTLFSKKGIVRNIGSYILIFIIISIIISGILFFKIGLHLFDTYIKTILKSKSKGGVSPKKSKKNIRTKKKKRSSRTAQSNPIKKKKLSEKAPKHVEIFKSKANLHKSNSKNDLKSSNELMNSKKYNFIEKGTNNKLNTIQNKYKSNLGFEKLNDYEINTLSYKSALQCDKRTFFEYYISLIRANNIVILAFFPLEDYNIRIIKICLFLNFFVIHYTLNTLFFTKSLIHEIYVDGGAYNISNSLPKIICSFFISYFLCSLIKYLSLSERLIIIVKIQPTYEQAEEKSEKIRKLFIIQNICFFSLSLIFLIFFWYYLSSFCAVYQNSQISLIKNVLISFALSLLFPFILYIIPSILRKISLKSKKTEMIYIISKFIQFI